MRRFLRAVTPSCAAFLVACSGTDAARGLADALFVRPQLVTIRDLRFGRHGLSLDVHRPRQPRRHAPVIVFLHAGRWKYGSREDYRVLGDGLTARGWVVVVPDYRKHPQVNYPAWVEDGADAVRWARDHVARFGGDSTRIFVIGHSSGAHTAALLALDERHLRSVGVAPESIRGYVALAGPVDTIWTDDDVQRLMGPRAGWADTYPRTHIDGSEPPMLLLHGGRDAVVHPDNAVRLADRIVAAGGCARAVVLPGLDHVRIVLALAAPRVAGRSVMNEVGAFVAAPTAACPAQARRK